MNIHVVEPGDYLYKIGQEYNVGYQKIALDNELDPHESLVVGQTLIIVPSNNFKKFRELEVNGYTFPNIDLNLLNKVLPSLTYLSIFSYRIKEDGTLNTIDDTSLIAIANNNGILPVMVVTNIGTNDKFDSDLAHYIFYNEDVQSKLIEEIVRIMVSKGYTGLNIDFEYVYQQDREAFLNFLEKVKKTISNYGYFLFVSVAPKTSDNQEGILYEAHDYKIIGELADRVVIMTYEWGYSGGEAMAVSPIKAMEGVLNYAVTVIQPNKILLGISNYGYDWTLPYVEGNLANSISNIEAVDLARTNRQFINYDYSSQTPNFRYVDSAKKKHEVWFEDARSINAKLELVIKYNLKGISYWTIDRPFPQNYLILNSLFEISKY